MWHRHHQNPKTDSLCCNNHVGFPIKIKLDPESSDIIRNKMGLLAFISLMQSKKVVLNELKRTPDQQIQLKQWKQYKKRRQFNKEKRVVPNWTRKSKRRRTLREMWEMNSRFSQSACTAIPTFTAFVIPPALAIFQFQVLPLLIWIWLWIYGFLGSDLQRSNQSRLR